MNNGPADREAGRGYDASDPDQVKSRRERQKTRDLQKKAALSRLMSDPGGRMWVWDLLVRCGAFRLSFSTDALVMAFNEGRRDIGNHLISELHQLGPELYMRMSLENQPAGPAPGGGAPGTGA